MRLSPCQNTDIRALQLTPFHRHRLITITISRLGDYSISSWADDSHHESFTVDTALPEMQSDEYDEDYHRAKNTEHHGLAMYDRGLLHTSFAHATSTSIDSDIRPLIYYVFDPFSSIVYRCFYYNLYYYRVYLLYL